MKRKTSGVVLFAVFAMVTMGAQSVMAGPVQTLTACLKEVPGEPLGTAVYSWWDDGKSRLEITVADAEPDATYCIFIDKTKLVAQLTVDGTGAGALRLDTRWGDAIPVVELGFKISLKNCPDMTSVLCGSFK
ncbi:MAG: hypothetical protein MUO87_06075 [Thermoplasmata archaeon]|nr:hypothetical protein [Thermoplasmata archaeon]